MDTGRVRPGREPFVRAEVMHSSERTRITRLFLPGHTVIRMEPLGPDGERLRQLRHPATPSRRLAPAAVRWNSWRNPRSRRGTATPGSRSAASGYAATWMM